MNGTYGFTKWEKTEVKAAFWGGSVLIFSGKFRNSAKKILFWKKIVFFLFSVDF
jgi:hypothetical protein